MKYNMNFIDMILHYAALMIVGITGGILQSPLIMVSSLFFFFCAILCWSPIYALFGINHHTGPMTSDLKEKEEVAINMVKTSSVKEENDLQIKKSDEVHLVS